jgi:hypothetical protein
LAGRNAEREVPMHIVRESDRARTDAPMADRGRSDVTHADVSSAR